MSSIEVQKQSEKATIHSLEVALNVLSKMVEKGRPLALKELSELCSEPPSKIHRYLSTLMSLEFVSQTHRHGAYTLGRGCIGLGLAAMRQVDLFQRIENGLERLAQQTTCHSFMSIWTTAGPIIIRWIFADDAVPVNTMPGQVFSVSRSSAGRIFAAFLPKSQTESLLQRELAALGEDSDYAKSIREQIDEARRSRYATSHGELESHLRSISVPVFDWHGNSLIVVGCVFGISTEESRVNASLKLLTEFADQMSLTPARSLYA